MISFYPLTSLHPLVRCYSRLYFYNLIDGTLTDFWSDSIALKISLKPNISDNNHSVTKDFWGSQENSWMKERSDSWINVNSAGDST